MQHDKIHEMSKSYELRRGVITASNILGTHLSPKTARRRVVQEITYCTALVTMSPRLSATASDLPVISREKGPCHKTENTFLHNCPS